MTDTPKPKWLTTKQAAEHLGISPERVRKLTREHKIRASRLGDAGNFRFTTEDLDAYIRPTTQQSAGCRECDGRSLSPGSYCPGCGRNNYQDQG